MFGFNRKQILKAIHALLQQNYGSYNDLIKLSILELSDIEKVIVSLDQQETLSKAGF
jgi:hypothetical protein